MNAKKLIVFLLWAFLPMVIVGGVKIKGTGPVSRITPPAEASTRGVFIQYALRLLPEVQKYYIPPVKVLFL